LFWIRDFSPRSSSQNSHLHSSRPSDAPGDLRILVLPLAPSRRGNALSLNQFDLTIRAIIPLKWSF
jgi:hypothetical protein